ncbi:MAG: ferritin-like domain-containing protein [Iphinoe sp. HA4291-MV1]|jgi:rubrerythrin|nr:ferritin-like domain-containing protein [Iphinoe sp. HA4291-MV1]
MRRKLSASRRNLLKWGLFSIGTAAMTTLPSWLSAQAKGSIKTLTFNADDIGILNFALLLEELEATFYALVLKSGKITDPKEHDYLQAIAIHEATHVKFLRKVLGSNATFARRELRFNKAGLDAVLKDRDTILNTAVALEDTGVHAYNGAGTSIKDPTYLLAAGSIVSVEARHTAGVRGLLNRSATELDSERAVNDADLVPELNPFKGRPYDELYTPKQIVTIVGSLQILKNPIDGALVA